MRREASEAHPAILIEHFRMDPRYFPFDFDIFAIESRIARGKITFFCKRDPRSTTPAFARDLPPHEAYRTIHASDRRFADIVRRKCFPVSIFSFLICRRRIAELRQGIAPESNPRRVPPARASLSIRIPLERNIINIWLMRVFQFPPRKSLQVLQTTR